MAAISLSAVGKTYPGGVRAVANISLEIADGEFIVLVGPSGCGKSTLLRMIAGLETLTDGDIRIGDRLVNTLGPAERDIAMVFQNYALYPHMSVRDNLAYGLRNRRVPAADIGRRVDEAARILELAPLLDRKPRALSGGQRQRVAMGRAIVRDPQAFLFDEPLSNLDAKLRGQMRAEIKLLQRRLSTTSVYVTHDQLEAMTLADRLVVINDGQIEQIGTPLDVYERPDSTFVASFIGAPAMNLVSRATLIAADPALDRLLPSDAATIGFRANMATIDPKAGIRTGIDLVEQLGSEQLVHCRLNGAPIVIVAPSAQSFDSEIGLSLPWAACHFFGSDGRRLQS